MSRLEPIAERDVTRSPWTEPKTRTGLLWRRLRPFLWPDLGVSVVRAA